ncbi:MAG: polysaccharide biosynthesis protein [Paludibacteraceae bacterium]|nr:polysaccharide biosynthesis protein [Paludibacteraceae bacterium]
MNFGLLIKLSKWYFSKKALPYWGVLLIDCFVIFCSYLLSFYLLNRGNWFLHNFWPMVSGTLLCTMIYALFFRLMHTFTGIIRYSSFVDMYRVIGAMLEASVAAWLFQWSLDFLNVESSAILLPKTRAIIIVFFLGTLLLCLERLFVKAVYDMLRENGAKLAFVYGVREGGISLAKSIRSQEPRKYRLKGFVSPNGEMEGMMLMGVKVYPDDDDLLVRMMQMNIDALIVSPLQSETFRERTELIDGLLQKGIKIMMMPQAEEWDGKSELLQDRMHEVDIEDLLPRKKIEVDMDAIGALLKDKKILITGAAGSIGSEIVRQVAKYNPEQMILIDQAETPMHDIRLMMARQFSYVKSQTIVTSIANQPRMESIFKEYKPDYVFHAAAYKHVPMMEDNPSEAVQNNIYGTRVIADLSVKYGTKKFVMVSTDKAVNPTNVMGCSKRICEIYCQSLNKAIVEGKVKGVTQFVTTRFGNVLGSNGSVIPLFREQIKNGGPVTVTHPDIIRFFMLISEACKLVLEAGTFGKGGEIFVFDMGDPVRIVDLAKRMISLSRVKNVDIVFTGLRDGEKLYEEVLNDSESTKPTFHPKIKIAAVREYDYEDACRNEDRLLEASRTYDDMAIVKVMKEIVPEFKSRHSKYEVLDKQD